MTCTEQSERLSLMLDNQLEEDERLDLQRHLQQCAACQQTWAAMQRIDATLHQSPLQHPPPEFVQKAVAAAIQRRQRDDWLFGGVSLLIGTLLVGGLVLATTFGANGIMWVLVGSPSVLVESPDIMGSLWSTLVLLGRSAWTFLSVLRQFLSIPSVAVTVLVVMLGSLAMMARMARRPTQTATRLT